MAYLSVLPPGKKVKNAYTLSEGYFYTPGETRMRSIFIVHHDASLFSGLTRILHNYYRLI